MTGFIDDLRAALHEMTEAGERYYSTLLESPDVEHVTAVPLEEHSWYTVKLDVYRRKTDGTLAGVTWDSPATEEQEGQDRNALVVEVEAYTTTSYRVPPALPSASADDVPPLGQVAYAAYYQASGGRSLVSGADLPLWHEQDPQIQAAWQAAAEAVRETP